MSTSRSRRVNEAGEESGIRAQLIHAALGVGGLKLISLPITLLASILLARGLGPVGYGQYVFVMAVITMLTLPVGPGIGQLVTREVARFHYSEDWRLLRGLLRSANQWVALGATVVVAGIMIIAGINSEWATNDRYTLLFIAGLLVPLVGLNAVRANTLRGLGHVFIAQMPELLVRPGFHLLIAGILLALGMLNPVSALASQIIATAVAFLLGACLLSYHRPQILKKVEPVHLNKEWGRAILPFTLLAAVSMMNGQIGILALGWLSTDEEVAALRVAQSGALLVVLSLTIVNQVIAPHITRAHREGDKFRLQQLSRQSARAALAASLPFALPLIFIGGPIVQLVYGEEYVAMVTWPLIIMVLGQLVNVAFGSVGLFLIMSGHEHDSLKGQLCALMVNFVAVVVLIPPLGVIGAAVGISLGLVTFNVVLAMKVSKRLGIGVTAFSWHRVDRSG